MNRMNLATEIAGELIKRFEGFRSRPYLCPAGVATIGYGATYYRDRTRVTLLDPPISRGSAYALLVWMVETHYMPDAIKLCPGANTQERVAALTDFTYNLGASRLSSSTLRRKINAYDFEAAKTELRKWVKGGGRILPGLVLRREAEVALLN